MLRDIIEDARRVRAAWALLAAPLAHRLGTHNVTSIEINPVLADHARRALTAPGYLFTVITADGADGYPPHAPYDRIIATAAVQQVPYPWVTQTRRRRHDPHPLAHRLPRRRAGLVHRQR